MPAKSIRSSKKNSRRQVAFAMRLAIMRYDTPVAEITRC